MKTATGIFTLFLISSSLVLNSTTASKILFVEFSCSKSHKLTYLPLVEELGKRGHRVTLLNPITYTKPMKNVKDILTLDWEAYSEKQLKEMNIEEGGEIDIGLTMGMIEDFCRRTYDLDVVKQLLKETFDLVIIQPMFNDCSLGLLYRLKAPYILYTPLTVPGILVEKLGGHFPPSYSANGFLGFSDEMTFSQRCINFGFNLMFGAFMDFYYAPKMTALYREKLGQDIPTVKEILNNASLILSNGHFSLHRPRSLLPDVIEVGGLHSFGTTKPVPKDIEDFIKKGKDGFIYFSMGSALKGSNIPEDKRVMFLNVFSKLKQQILWKWETETMPNLPKNVKLSKWLPQQDLLAHKDIKMFITHCGGGSLEEAAFHGSPILGLPMFGDQPSNAKLASSQGFAIDLDWNKVTEEDLMKAVQEILENPKYPQNSRKISAYFKDQPDSPVNKAAYWVEYVIRHKGAPHLRSAGRKLNWFQYHSYDVILTYVGLISLTLYLIFAILRWIIRKTCCRSSSMKTGKSKRE